MLLSFTRVMAVDLRTGHPQASELPYGIMSKALTAAAPSLQYGNPRGNPGFLDWLSSFLARNYGSPTRPLMVTNGCSHGLDLALTLLQKDDIIVCERPTYFLATGILKDHQLQIRTVGVDEQGMNVDALENALRAGLPVRAVYVVPRHGNPSGASLSEDRRSRLASLAEEFDFWIFADEVYELLDWGGTTHRMCGNKTVSLSSFSKILSPALRLGWIEAEEAVIDRLARRGYIRSGGGVAPFLSEVVANADVEDHLCMLREKYKLKSQAAILALRAASDVLTPLVEPSGGYFIWVKLPVKATDLHSPNATFLPGPKCDPGGTPLEDNAPSSLEYYARLCFAFNDPDAVSTGIAAIAAALRETTCRRRPPPPPPTH